MSAAAKGATRRRIAGAAAVAAVLGLTAPAMAADAAPATAPAGAAVLTVNRESFTRGDLTARNATLFATDATHSALFREAWLNRFINFRLVVQEARSKGLGDTQAFRDRHQRYLDLKAAALLVKDAVPEDPVATGAEIKQAAAAQAGRSETEIAGEIADAKRAAAINRFIAAAGVELPVTRRYGDASFWKKESAPAFVVAEVGPRSVLLSDVQASLKDRRPAGEPSERDLIGVIDDLILERTIAEAARRLSYRDRIAAADLAAFEEKLLEELFIEQATLGQSITEEDVSKAYEEFKAAQKKGQQAPPLESMRSMMVETARKKLTQAKMSGEVARLRQQAEILIDRAVFPVPVPQQHRDPEKSGP